MTTTQTTKGNQMTTDLKCQGERCLAVNGFGHSRECIMEAGRVQGWTPTEEDFAKCGPSAPNVQTNEQPFDERAELKDQLLYMADDPSLDFDAHERDALKQAAALLEADAQRRALKPLTEFLVQIEKAKSLAARSNKVDRRKLYGSVLEKHFDDVMAACGIKEKP